MLKDIIRNKGYIITDNNNDSKRKAIIAVDFDNTLFVDEYPNVGEPIFPVIKLIKYLRYE